MHKKSVYIRHTYLVGESPLAVKRFEAVILVKSMCIAHKKSIYVILT